LSINCTRCGNSIVITPSCFNNIFIPPMKSTISGTCARTLLPKRRSAAIPFSLSCFASLTPKKSTTVGMFFSIATLAVFAVGSIPRTGIFF
jgi:hypothetical protein